MKIIGLNKKVGFLLASLMVISGVFGIVNTEQFFSLKKVEETRQQENAVISLEAENMVEMMMPCPDLNFTCKEMNLSLDENCEAIIDPNQFLHITPQNLPRDTFIVVVTDMVTGAVHSDEFGIEDIGKVFKVSISVRDCDNAPCWSRLLIEDKLPPTIVCTSDTINCNEDYRDYFDIETSDNCFVSDTSSTVVYNTIFCNDPLSALYLGYYEINWIVTDLGGKMDSCTQEIYVRRPNLEDITVPPPATVECGDFNGLYPPESLTGNLLLDGNILTSSSEELCMAELTKKDTILSPSTSCDKIIRRDWELIIWTCGAPIIRRFTQIIIVEDNTPPTLSPIADITINLTSENCLWTGNLPRIIASDCNQNKLQYEVIYPGGIIIGNGPEITLGQGIHQIIYRVTDGVCGNVSRQTFNIVILDKISPVALCASPIVAISSNGEGILTAADVNKGSYDYCGTISSVKIMRLEKTCNFDTIWADTVTYCCTDVGRTDLMVALRVEDGSGNFNICMASVEVQNKIIPDAVYPDDTMVTCSLPIDLGNLSNTFGRPMLIGTECPNNASFDTTYIDMRDACGLGKIIRRFGLRYQGFIIERDSQVITIIQDVILQPEDVDWPEEEVMAELGKTDTSFTGSPTWPILPCNVIGMSMKDDTFGTAANGTCFKIERTFKIINWCGPNKNEVLEDFIFRQIIKVVDTIGPVIITSDSLRTICSFADNCLATELAILTAQATDNGPQGDLYWTYSIDIFKDGLDIINGFGDSVAIQAPVGRHSVTFTVTDACGSSDQITYDFVVKNCKGPIAKCVNLVTMPMGGPGGMVEICAKDFNARSEDICSDTSSLLFTFNGVFPVPDSLNVVHYFKGNGQVATLAEYNAGTAQRWDPVSKTSCRIFTCATPRTFFMTVWDEDGNAGDCQVTLILEGCCIDTTPPIITSSDTTRRILNTLNNCEGPVLVNLSASATDNLASTASLMWTFELDRNNNGTIDSTGNGNNINVNLPAGTHKVKFIVEDSCFNEAMVMYLIEVYNDKGPDAICRDTLRITLETVPDMDPMYILSAKDLDNITTPSFDSCSTDELVYTFSGAYPVRDSINKVHYFTNVGLLSNEAAFLVGNALRWNPITRAAEVKLGCGQVGTFTRTLTVWDRDERSSSCPTTIVLTGDCPENVCEIHEYTGVMVATCTAPVGTNETVAVLYDIRPNGTVNRTRNWQATVLAPFPSQNSVIGANWKIDSIGQVFGIATDDSANVYLAHSDVYLVRLNQNPNGTYIPNQPANIPPGRIYKARPPLFKAEEFVTLPVSLTPSPFNGLGNIVYDRKHNQLFATNLEDGKIYRISNTGVILQSYDPFSIDNNAPGIVDQSEQVWAIGINFEGSQTKLYFPRIGPDSLRRMYSLTLDANGAFTNVANSEVVVINNIPGTAERITDISFDNSGTRMLLAERSGAAMDKILPDQPTPFEYLRATHSSIAVNYNLVNGTWTFGSKYNVGTNVTNEIVDNNGIPVVNTGENSAGGVDFGFRENNGDPFADRDSLGWFSGNWMHKGDKWFKDQTNPRDDSLYYGAQAIDLRPSTNGNAKTDIIIDFDNSGTNFGDKGQIGDVEVFRCKFVNTSQLVALAGNVATPSDDKVEGVQINLLDRNQNKAVTNFNGEFEMHNLEKDAKYTVAPTKNDDVTNGINVIDLLHLQRHILGITRLNTAYKQIAGDINNDQKLNINDIIALRKVILGVDDKFENNSSWRFVDKTQTLDNSNPWTEMIREYVEFNSLSQNAETNFVGVKIGDLDGNVLANSTQLQQRNSNTHQLFVESMEGNDWLRVPVYSDDGFHAAMQLNFKLNGFELKEIQSGQLTILPENISIVDGQYKLITMNNNQITIGDEQPLFYLVVKGKAKFDASRLEITTASFLYNDGGQISELQLMERNKGANAQLDQALLHQNYPNPWDNVTKIAFDLKKDGNVTLNIFDLTGKQVFRKSISGQAGSNTVLITADELPGAGMYNYTLQIGEMILNKRFILMSR
jgi:hypothetical protein